MLLILALRKQNVFVKLGPAWPTQWVPRLPELHSETKSNTKKGQIRLPIHHSSASKPAAHGGLRRHGVHLGIKGQPAMVALDAGLCVLWRLWCYLWVWVTEWDIVLKQTNSKNIRNLTLEEIWWLFKAPASNSGTRTTPCAYWNYDVCKPEICAHTIKSNWETVYKTNSQSSQNVKEDWAGDRLMPLG